MKKVLLYLVLALFMVVGYFVYSKKINSVDSLKRALFELSHNRNKVAEQEAFNIGYNAYTYGFVKVKGMLLQEKATHPKYHDYAPINAFAISKELAKPGFTDFTPNSDTYYGLAWLDVSKGPIMMEIPEVSSKYWTIQATDASLNTFKYIGSRLKTKPGLFAYCKYDWKGNLPANSQRIDCPTNQVFLQARNLVLPGNKLDQADQYRLMLKYKLYALNKEAKYESISADSPMANPLNTNPDLKNLNFFKLLNKALTLDPPTQNDKGLVDGFSKLNIGSNLVFDEKKLSPSQIEGLKDGVMAALHHLYDELKYSGERIGGFNFRYDMGRYGSNYIKGATVAFYGYGANAVEEAAYPNSLVDSNGDDLVGVNSYKIHFNKNEFPPVNAFWSVTMYNRPENQLVDNEINRYNIGGLTPGLKYNADGSLDILIQHKRPKEINNWLPAPEGDFWLILRMYEPKEQILQKKYITPKITKI